MLAQAGVPQGSPAEVSGEDPGLSDVGSFPADSVSEVKDVSRQSWIVSCSA